MYTLFFGLSDVYIPGFESVIRTYMSRVLATWHEVAQLHNMDDAKYLTGEHRLFTSSVPPTFA